LNCSVIYEANHKLLYITKIRIKRTIWWAKNPMAPIRKNKVDDGCQKTKRRVTNLNPSSNSWEKVAMKRCFFSFGISFQIRLEINKNKKSIFQFFSNIFGSTRKIEIFKTSFG